MNMSMSRPPVASVTVASDSIPLRRRRTLASIIMSILFAVSSACGGRTPEAGPEPMSVTSLLGRAPDDEFARVTGPRPFEFPRDHGSHPDYHIEWWYFTGQVATPSGRRFGFQLTFFRTGLAATAKKRDSAWGSRDAWMAHFTLTDVASGRFHAFERFSRGAAGLSGVTSAPLFHVWLDHWEVIQAEGDAFPGTLRAQDDDIALELNLRATKPPILQGERGYSRKGEEVGNASHYVSLTRIAADGHVHIGSDVEGHFEVTGDVWMDHEWSTSSLSSDLVGWDWFSLHLDDGRELMLYQLRREDGTPGPFSAGAIIDTEGAVRRLSVADFTIDVLERWESPATGARYPSRWTLRVPSDDLVLEVEPRVADQELRHTVAYWEGACRATGRRGGGSVTGEGYVELVGYASD